MKPPYSIVTPWIILVALSTQQNFLLFKISFFLDETIGGGCILLHTYAVRKTNLQYQGS